MDIVCLTDIRCTPKYIVNLVMSNMSIHIDVGKQSSLAIRAVW